MKLKMAENSLFAILLRSAWWMSAAIALAIAAMAALLLPPKYVVFGVFAGLPFIVIAAIAGWRQLQAPGAARVERTLEALRAMPWNEFAQTVEDALRKDGYAVERIGVPEAEFEATRAGRRTLVSCKRWKVARTGVNPLRELHEATSAREADDAIYFAVGEVTDQARAFAAQKRIRLLEGPALVQWFPAIGKRAAR